VVQGNPYLIEYNARFGDPECQPMMLRLKHDLLDILDACASGNLNRYDEIEFSSNVALGVVMAANGYPNSYTRGGIIGGLDKAANDQGIMIFHAGTKKTDNGNIVANGGRVLCVTASGDDVEQAQQRAYGAVDKIEWEGGFCRRDIGYRAVKALKTRT